MKRIHIETHGNKTAKVFRDSEWQEFRVRLYINGALHAGADYFTNEKADAIATAAAMVRPREWPEPCKAFHLTPLDSAGNAIKGMPPVIYNGTETGADFMAARAIRYGAASVLTEEWPPVPRPLSVRFNVAVLHIAGRILPNGFDVSENAPQTFDSLVAHYEKTGRILVWNGASEKTIFADSEINFAFRAWHDSKHILGNHDFTIPGEMAALELQQADIRAIFDGATADYFCAIVDAEIRGQAMYNLACGGFPIDQAGFARAFLADAESAIDGAFGISAEAI